MIKKHRDSDPWAAFAADSKNIQKNTSYEFDNEISHWIAKQNGNRLSINTDHFKRRNGYGFETGAECLQQYGNTFKFNTNDTKLFVNKNTKCCIDNISY